MSSDTETTWVTAAWGFSTSKSAQWISVVALPERSRPARVAVALQLAAFVTPCTVSRPSSVNVHCPLAGSGDGRPVTFCGSKVAVLNLFVSIPNSWIHLSRRD